MSENNRHEPQDERIERLLRERQPTGNKLLDSLGGTVPRARPDFQQQLEGRLLDRLHVEGERKALMTVTSYAGAMKPRRSIPLTLAAAMMAVVIAGGILLTVNRTNPGVAAQPGASATLTPTPILYEHVVQPGETLGSIIQSYGYTDPNVVDEILRINGMSGRDVVLTPGAVILIPQASVANNAEATPTPGEPLGTPIPALMPVSGLPAATPAQVIPPTAGRTDSIAFTEVRQSPGSAAPVIGSFYPGTIVAVLGRSEDGDWLYVQARNGVVGWVAAEFIDLPANLTFVIPAAEPPPAIPQAVIGMISVPQDAFANLRAGPSAQARVVDRLANGTMVEWIGENEDGDWLRVRLEDGREGWTMASLVQPSSTPAVTPVSYSLPGIIVPVQGTQALIYAGPGESYAVIDRLDAGTQVNVVRRTEDSAWLRIQTPSGRDGWISSNEVELPSVPVVELAVSATPIPAIAAELTAQEMLSLPIPLDGRIVAEASVYASLDISAPVIAQVSPETLVVITGAAGGSDQERALLQIQLDDGTEGWVDARLVEILPPPTPVVMAVEATPVPANAVATVMPTVVPQPAPVAVTALGESVAPSASPIYAVIMPPAGEGTSVLNEPETRSDGSNIVGFLSTGTIVEVIGQRPDGQWLFIRQFSKDGGIEGWVIAEAVDFQAASLFSAAPATVATPVIEAAAHYQPVVIALQDLPHGSRIERRDLLAVIYWPADILPDGSFTDPASVVGYYVTEDIARWQPVLASVLSARNPMETNSSSLPPGTVAVAVPLDLIESIAYGVVEGDRVNVIVSFLFVDVDDQFQAITATVNPNEARLVTQNIVSSAEVVYIGRMESEGGSGGMDVITLAVSPQEAEILTWAIEAGVTIRLEIVDA